MKKSLLTTLVASAALVLAGCSGSNTAAENPQTPEPSSSSSSASTSSTPSPTGASESASNSSSASSPTPAPTGSVETAEASKAAPSSSADNTCASLTEDEAVGQNIATVPETFPESGEATSWVKASDGTYDPCAELSYVVLGIKGATASSPFQIMLFHHGEYLGTPAKTAFGFYPEIEQSQKNQITVGYRWPEGTESNAEAKVRATSTFTYNAKTGGVDHSGDFPTYKGMSADGALPADVAVEAGAPAAIGGDTPANAVQGTAPVGDIATFKTEDGNIRCDMRSGDRGASCVAESLLNNASKGGSVEAGTAGMVEFLSKYPTAHSYAPQAPLLAQDEGITVLPAGESVYFGDSICLAESNAVSCWSMTGTQGFYATADRYITF